MSTVCPSCGWCGWVMDPESTDSANGRLGSVTWLEGNIFGGNILHLAKQRQLDSSHFFDIRPLFLKDSWLSPHWKKSYLHHPRLLLLVPLAKRPLPFFQLAAFTPDLVFSHCLQGTVLMITFISLVLPWFSFVWFEKGFHYVAQVWLVFKICLCPSSQMLTWPRWVDLLSDDDMLVAVSNPASERPHLCSTSCFHRICFCSKLKKNFIFDFDPVWVCTCDRSCPVSAWRGCWIPWSWSCRRI